MAGIAEELTQLAQLKAQGVLTPDEFEQQKARLLQGQSGPAPAAVAPPPPPRARLPALPMLAGIALLVIVIAGFGAYAGGPFPSHRTGSFAASQGASQGAARPPALATQAGNGPLPASVILADFKADPIGAKAKYNHTLAVQATVMKAIDSVMRVDAGDSDARVLWIGPLGSTADQGLIGRSVIANCQKPEYEIVSGKVILSFEGCTIQGD